MSRSSKRRQRQLNKAAYRMHLAGVTTRKIAEYLGCDPKDVKRRVELGKLAAIFDGEAQA